MRVNCLNDARLIVAGQALYLPPLSPAAQPTTIATQSSGNDNHVDDNSGGNDNSGNDNQDDHDDDHDNDNEDEHDD